MPGPTPGPGLARVLVVGLGTTGQAVASGLKNRGSRVTVVDDRSDAGIEDAANRLGVELVTGPTEDDLAQMVAQVDAVIPSPGVPSSHAVHRLSAQAGVEVLGELDLAARWDSRPVVAITGTNGKTSVTCMVTEMLTSSGVVAVAAGNTDLPLVQAIDDGAVEVFVVEASSFRLEQSPGFRPRVGTWLNVAPDHLDWHPNHDDYVRAKARIWDNQQSGDVAVAPLADPLIMGFARRSRARLVTFGAEGADYRVEGADLVGPEAVIVPVAGLRRALPHDLQNALAASATALAAGATLAGVRDVLTRWIGLPHRVQTIGAHDGVTYVDDSKATAPHATLAAAGGFESVVLIAGGRNKGLDLGVLRDLAPRLRGVVAIGEAADDLLRAFEDLVPVTRAASMDEAVHLATAQARPGDTVLLSPACASFDWYRGYAERGEAFARAVGRVTGTVHEGSP